jgi:hypothetical protein
MLFETVIFTSNNESGKPAEENPYHSTLLGTA